MSVHIHDGKIASWCVCVCVCVSVCVLWCHHYSCDGSIRWLHSLHTYSTWYDIHRYIHNLWDQFQGIALIYAYAKNVIISYINYILYLFLVNHLKDKYIRVCVNYCIYLLLIVHLCQRCVLHVVLCGCLRVHDYKLERHSKETVEIQPSSLPNFSVWQAS